MPFDPIVDPALSQVVVERGVDGEVRDGRGELSTFTYSTPHMSTIVVENKVRIPRAPSPSQWHHHH